MGTLLLEPCLSNLFKVRNLCKTLLSLMLVIALAACGESGDEQEDSMHLDRANAYQDQGQYKAAIIEYKNAVKKTAGATDVIVQYANMFNKLGLHPSALTLLEQVKTNQNKAYYLELVETFLAMNKYLSAEATIKEHLTVGVREVDLLNAEVLFGLRENDKAERIYDALLSKDSNDADALLGKAQVLIREERVDDAAALLARIPQQSSVFAKSKILTANIEISHENLEAAESILSELLSRMRNTDIIEPEKAIVLERLSYVLTRQGRTNEAYIYTKLLAEAFPGANEANEQYNEAVESFRAGDLVAAKGILAAILESYPRHKKAAQLSGIISYLEGDAETASKFLSDSVDPEVANPMATHIYAATNLKLNEPKKVLELLEPGISRTKIPQTLALYGLAAISDKQYRKGENALLRAIEIAPDNVRIRLALAGLYRSSPIKNKDKEWQQLKTANERAPEDIQVLKDMVSFHLRDGGIEKASQFVNDALKQSPKSYAVNMIAGHFSASQSKQDSALKYYSNALAANGEKGRGYLEALFAKGKTELALLKPDAAEITFSELVQAFPENGLGYKGLLAVYMKREGLSAAQQRLEALAKRNSKVAPYIVLIESALANRDIELSQHYYNSAVELGGSNETIEGIGRTIQYVEAVIAVNENNFDKARENIASVLVAEPGNMKVLSFLVDLEIKVGRLKEAKKVLQQLEDIDASHPVVPLLKGDLAQAENLTEKAQVHYAQAWRDNPSEVAADKLFKVLAQLKDEDARRKHLRSWLAKFPDSSQAHFYQAIDYQQRGQRTKAVESYEAVLKQAPDNVVVLNNLGWIYFEKNDSRALELLEKAVELAPDNAAVLDSYGWVLVKNNRVKEGLDLLEKASKLAPDNEEIASHYKEAKAL